MAVYILYGALTLAVMAVLHLRMWLFIRGEPVQAQTASDPTYWALLAGFSLFLTALIVETARHDALPSGPTVWAGYALAVASLALTKWARHCLGGGYAPTAEHPSSDQVLVRSGPYRYLRHPIYVGNALMVVGLLLAFELRYAWLTLIPFTAALIWRVKRENAFLRRRFGPEA